jgi:hypothetical protein
MLTGYSQNTLSLRNFRGWPSPQDNESSFDVFVFEDGDIIRHTTADRRK